MLACLGVLAGAVPAAAVTITEFPAESGVLPRYIHVGPDQNLWFAQVGPSPGIGRMSPSGEQLQTIPDAHNPVDLVVLTDGTVVWTADQGLGRRLPGGGVSTIETANTYPAYAVALTSSGELRWTARYYYYPGSQGWVCGLGAGWGETPACKGAADSRLTGLTLGADGRLWVAGYEGNYVARMNAATDAFDLQLDLPVGSGPARLALASDGNLWVTMYGAGAIDRIAPSGVRTRFSVSAGSGPNDIVAGPDGALWFTELKGNRIGRMTTDGVLTNEFPIPSPDSQPIGITAGPDGAIWFTESRAGKIGRLQLDAALPGGLPAGGGLPGAVFDTFAPRFVSALAAIPARFRVAKTATAVSSGKRSPAGTKLRFSLSEPGAVTISFLRARPGRRVNGTCRSQSRSNARQRRCTRYAFVGALRRHGLQGANAIAFSGRLGKRALTPGAYRASALARDAAGNLSKPSVAGFTIVRR
jgi:streptogramin lyase